MISGAENGVFDLENRDRYDLSMMKLSHAFTYDGREAELEVIEEGPTVLVNIKVLFEVCDTQRVEATIFDGDGPDEIEMVVNRRKAGQMIQVRFDRPDWRALVEQLGVFGRVEW